MLFPAKALPSEPDTAEGFDPLAPFLGLVSSILLPLNRQYLCFWITHAFALGLA